MYKAVLESGVESALCPVALRYWCVHHESDRHLLANAGPRVPGSEGEEEDHVTLEEGVRDEEIARPGGGRWPRPAGWSSESGAWAWLPQGGAQGGEEVKVLRLKSRPEESQRRRAKPTSGSSLR